MRSTLPNSGEQANRRLENRPPPKELSKRGAITLLILQATIIIICQGADPQRSEDLSPQGERSRVRPVLTLRVYLR